MRLFHCSNANTTTSGTLEVCPRVPRGDRIPRYLSLETHDNPIRLISALLKAQGTMASFFPPVKDCVGWADGGFTTFALVDYAGLANQYLKGKLGTQVTGTVVARRLPKGKTQVTVALYTTRALGFAQDIQALSDNDFDFLKTPTIFGNKAQDVDQGALAAVGPASLFTSFTIKGGIKSPPPDFWDVVNNPANYAPVNLTFNSATFGTCKGNKAGYLSVFQRASTNPSNELIYSEEQVDVTCISIKKKPAQGPEIEKMKKMLGR